MWELLPVNQSKAPNPSSLFMKKKLQGAVLLLLAVFNLQHSTAHAQGTAFTYQGRLNSGGSAASGSYDFRFKLYADALGNVQVGGSYLTNAIPVTNGLFLTTIDFGAGIFTGNNYWLEVDVKTNGAGSYTVLNPFQSVTPTPYAVFANAASNILGTIKLAQLPSSVVTNGASGLTLAGTLSGSASSFSGSLAGDVTGTQGATVVGTVGGSTAANVHAAELLANAATTNNTANTLVLRDANGSYTAPLALALPNLRTTVSYNGPTFVSANVIAGSTANTNAPSVTGVVIAGGGATAGFPQIINANYSSIGGGYSDLITANGSQSVIAGGVGNTADAAGTSIGGGQSNTGSGQYSTIGGGNANTASGNNSTVPGGLGNTASGLSSFAAGNRAKAVNNGSFVWGDSTPVDFSSTANDQFAVRASGGVTFQTAGAGLKVDGQPVLSGNVSDAHLSTNVALLNANQTFSGINNLTNAANVISGNGSGLSGVPRNYFTGGIISASIPQVLTNVFAGPTIPPLTLTAGQTVLLSASAALGTTAASLTFNFSPAYSLNGGPITFFSGNNYLSPIATAAGGRQIYSQSLTMTIPTTGSYVFGCGIGNPSFTNLNNNDWANVSVLIFK